MDDQAAANLTRFSKDDVKLNHYREYVKSEMMIPTCGMG